MKSFSDDVLLKAILDGIKRSQAALDHEAEIRAVPTVNHIRPY
jgi:hypothetical protein